MNSPWFRYRDVWAPEVLSGWPFAGDAVNFVDFDEADRRGLAVIAGGLVASWHD